MITLWIRKLLVLGAFAGRCCSFCSATLAEPAAGPAHVAAGQTEGQETHG